MGGKNLCRGLGLLKSHLVDLEVDDRLLDVLQKWDCITPKQVNDLKEKPPAERLDSLMLCLESREPSKWPFLVCVFLEIHCDELANKTWEAVQAQLGCLQTAGKQTEALDIWGSFVRQTYVALVLDQQEIQEQTLASPTTGLTGLGDRQRKTASKIWKAMVKESLRPTNRSESDLDMWKILVNSASHAMSGTEQKANLDLWKEFVGSALERLKSGKREAALLMYKYLLGQAKRVAFSPEVSQHILGIMVEFMLQVQDTHQRALVNDVMNVLVEYFFDLFSRDQTAGFNQKSAHSLFNLLKKCIPKLLEKDAKKCAKDLFKALTLLLERLPENSERDAMRTDLFQELSSLKADEQADTPDLKEMRATLSSGTWSTEAAAGSFVRADDDGVPSFSAQQDAPLISCYPMTSRSIRLALVINNVDFSHASFERRDGSDMDALALPLLLEKLGFHVQQVTNLGRDDLLGAIAAFAHRPEHESADVAALAVMTHGVNEGLVGSDGGVLSFQAVVDCFSNENAPHLANKPKWLSLQACRTTSDEIKLMPDRLNHSGALFTDLFVTYTTLPGRYAIRHKVEGTWYVQALKDALDLPGAHELSLFELHMKVHEIMSAIWKKEKARCQRGEEELFRAEPKLEVRALGWTKKLYFRQIHDS